MITRGRWRVVVGGGLSLLALASFPPRNPWTGGAIVLAQQRPDPPSLARQDSSELRRGPAEALRAKADKAQAFEEEFEKGRQLLQRHEYFDALKSFQRANQLAGGRSAECHLNMARAMNGMKAYQNAVGSAQTAIELAGNDGLLLARAHSVRGQALQALAEKDATKLPDAEAEFRQALVTDPDSRVADLHFNLGFVLMLQNRDEDGIAEMKREIAIRANGTTAERARELMANPRRARENFAPEFSIVSLEGERITLESLRGKVALLDFWGTWCQPCVRALPSIKKLQKAHAKDAFVIVGISSDEDEQTWRTFTAKNQMVWPQYRDRDRTIERTFGVSAFPTYVLIDPEGIERFRISGTGFDRADALSSEIEKQLKRTLRQP